MLILTVIQGPDKGRRFELPDMEPQLIGRSSEALPVTDNAISRRHAELTPDDGAWYIRDLDSQNGTYVNSVRILERTRLKPGDQVRCGQTLLVFGTTESRDPDVVRVVGPRQVDSTIERAIPSTPPPGLVNVGTGSNEDSIILAEPEPRAAAAEHLRVIYRLTTMLSNPVSDRRELLSRVLDLVFAEFRPQRGCIMLVDDAPGAEAVPAVIKYRDTPLDQDEARISVSRTILQHVLTRHEGVLSSNAMTDPRFAKGDSVQQLHIRSAICSPIRFRERTYGAVYIDTSISNYTFTQEQLALANAIGQHVGLALANADLYQQKLQAERLAAIGETVATLSHSIKNILQGLRGGADVVEMGLKKDDLKIARGGWAIQKRNLDRIISLTMNMLAFSRQRKPEFELVQVAPLLEDCAGLLESQCAAKQVAMIVDADPELPPVALDTALVHQAIMNLLTNAVDAAPTGTGAVTLRAQYKPARQGARPEIVISVVDNGPGIPVSKQPWVYEPFATTKGAKGTGLGLAVAKRIVEEHSGRIELESSEGRGATFRLILPADLGSSIDPSATAQSRTSNPAGGAESVRPGV